MGFELEVHRFARSAAEMTALREVCRIWSEGPERFWAFDDVLQAVTRPSSLVLFAAESASAPWQAVALVDVGPFSADLLYIWVRPERRRGGLARVLLARLFAELTARPQIEALFLEVRESNTGAQALYRALGMEPIGRRRAYYANGEDAFVFRYALRKDHDA